MPSESELTRRPARRSRYVGNLVLKIQDMKVNEERDACFPGVALGEAAGGTMNGRKIAVSLRRTPTNSRAPKIEDFADKDSMSHTGIGGYVAFENVRERDGHFTATWANKFADPDDTLRVGMPMLISPSYDRDGEERRFAGGARIYNAHVLHAKDSESVRSTGELRDAIECGLSDRGAVFLASCLGDPKIPGSFNRKTMLAWRGSRDGEPKPIADAVEELLAGEKGKILNEALQDGGVVDVIPMESMRLGPKTSESIDLGGRQAVSLNSFATGGLGSRVESAIRRTDAVRASRIEQAFLASCHPELKAAFSQRGWRGVWNRDVQQFFFRHGVALPLVPSYGFAVGTALMKSFEPRQKAGPDMFMAKARALSAPLPRDAVPTPSDKDSHARYYEEFQFAVQKVAEALPDGPELQFNNASKDPHMPPVNEAGTSARLEPSPSVARFEEVPDAISDRSEPDLERTMGF